MNVTKPDEWKGSDLRSRTEIVTYLRQRGGEVTDQTGLVVGTMRQELGKGRALSQLLADMEADGMLEREVRGRRTFRITLKDDWGLAPKLSAVPVQPEEDAALPSVSSEEDYDQLAHALLAICLKRAAAPPPPDRREIDRLETELAVAKAERDEVRAQCSELEEQVRILTHNQGVLQAQLDKRPARSGPTIAERLSADELATLAQLQRELPATPTSKPRTKKR